MSLMSTQGHQTAQGPPFPISVKLADVLNKLLRSSDAEANTMGLDTLHTILESTRLDRDWRRNRDFDRAFDHAFSLDRAIDRADSLCCAFWDECGLGLSDAEMSTLAGLVIPRVLDLLERYDERVRENAQSILHSLGFHVNDDDLLKCVVLFRVKSRVRRKLTCNTQRCFLQGYSVV